MSVSFFPSGDSAVTVEFGREVSEECNCRVLSLERSLRLSPIPGLIETIPTYRSLLVLFDPARIRYSALCAQLEQRLQQDTIAAEESGRLWKIPCCYGMYFGPDLKNVQAHSGLSPEEIIRRHSSVDYRIYMLGFLPGFVYLGGLDGQLATPRLKVPRLEIPRGAVGIGGSQTGIYPMASPGGWQLIGRTPLELYDPRRSEPVLCRAGDYIRFVPISGNDYYDIRSEVLHGSYSPEYSLMAGKEG